MQKTLWLCALLVGAVCVSAALVSVVRADVRGARLTEAERIPVVPGGSPSGPAITPVPPAGTELDRALARIDVLERRLSAMHVQVARFRWLLEHVDRNGDTLILKGANLNIVNGEGSTETTNGLGNLIIGYNEERAGADAAALDDPQDQIDLAAAAARGDDRSGSHMLVLGSRNNYTSFGGIVAGKVNETSGGFASVLGGAASVASGEESAIVGGSGHTASGRNSVVAGGFFGTASGLQSVVSGGDGGMATGPVSGVFGGQNNEAMSDSSAVCGGVRNIARAGNSTVCGGSANEAVGGQSTVCGGIRNRAGGTYSTVSGGEENFASGRASTVSGGEDNEARGEHSAVAGGKRNQALGSGSLISEGCGRFVLTCGGP